MKGGQQGQSGTGSMDVLWISVFFVLLIAFLWYEYSVQILTFVYHINYYKLSLVQKVLYLIKDANLFNVDPYIEKLDITFNGIGSLIGDGAGFKELREYTAESNKFFVYPYSAFATIYALYLLFFSSSSSFKKIFNMKKLHEQEKVNWPYINCVPKNLINKDLDSGSWAMSIQPLQFILNHDLADKEPVYGEVKLTLRDKHVYEVFSRQLGTYWTGRMDCMPNYAKALFAIFAAKGNGDDAGARKLIDQIAISASSGNLNFNGSTALIIKHIQSKGVGRAVSPHAYLLTAMASMLEYARTGGVLAMAELLWLKKVDRKLWYMLQSVGRQTPFVEAAAAYSHWITEKRLRRPLKVPMVNEAVKSVVSALTDIKYNPDGY